MINYKSNKRLRNSNWIYLKINELLNEAILYEDFNKLIYACFETRNLIELIEIDYVLLPHNFNDLDKALEVAKDYGGIRKSFNRLCDKLINEWRKINNKPEVKGLKFKDRIHKYQLFIMTLLEVEGNNNKIKFKYFDFEKSEKHKNVINDYCHLYVKTEKDFSLKSQFSIDAIKEINKIFEWLHNSEVLTSDLVSLPLEGLNENERTIFSEWLIGKISSQNELKEQLRLSLN